MRLSVACEWDEYGGIWPCARKSRFARGRGVEDEAAFIRFGEAMRQGRQIIMAQKETALVDIFESEKSMVIAPNPIAAILPHLVLVVLYILRQRSVRFVLQVDRSRREHF